MALVISSVSTSDSGVASCAGIMPNLPMKSMSICWSRIVARSTLIFSRFEITLSKSTISSTVWLSPSCTIAMVCTRRCASASSFLTSWDLVLRAWSRSSADTDCRLFFTRWWISEIAASLVCSSFSRRRSSVTSRHSTMPPVLPFASYSGSERIETAERFASSSESTAALPLNTNGSVSGTGSFLCNSWVPISLRYWPIMARNDPRRRKQLMAFGEA